MADIENLLKIEKNGHYLHLLSFKKDYDDSDDNDYDYCCDYRYVG